MSNGQVVDTKRERLVFSLARVWLNLLVYVATIAFAGIVSVILGLTSLSGAIPLQNAIIHHPIFALLIGGMLLFVTIASLRIVRPSISLGQDNQGRNISLDLNPALISATISTTSTLLFAALLLTVVVRPTWCPTAICGTADLYPGVHDDHVNLYLTQTQSAAYELVSDPAAYTVSDLPHTILASRIDERLLPTEVVITVHSIDHGPYPIVIEQVFVVIRQSLPLPYPLNVWIPTDAHRSYASNPFSVMYSFQDPGTLLAGKYVPQPLGHVQLLPGESDTLDIQLSSVIPADVAFSVEITYRLANEEVVHTLMLPNVFEAVFSNHENWHAYVVRGAKLAAVT